MFALISQFVFLAGLVGGISAQAEDLLPNLSKWAITPAVNPTLSAQMSKFGDTKSKLSDRYKNQLANTLQVQTLQRGVEATIMLRNGSIPDAVNVEFLEEGFSGVQLKTESEKDFEKDFLRVEVSAQLGKYKARDAAAVYFSEPFRKSINESLASYKTMGSLTCEKILPGLLGFVPGMDYCLLASRYSEPGLEVNFSQLVSNGSDPNLNPIYFRQSYTSFIQDTSETLHIYFLYYLRSDVPWGTHGLVKSKIKSTQAKTISRLREELAR